MSDFADAVALAIAEYLYEYGYCTIGDLTVSAPGVQAIAAIIRRHASAAHSETVQSLLRDRAELTAVRERVKELEHLCEYLLRMANFLDFTDSELRNRLAAAALSTTPEAAEEE